jgi:hypothetical protein
MLKAQEVQRVSGHTCGSSDAFNSSSAFPLSADMAKPDHCLFVSAAAHRWPNRRPQDSAANQAGPLPIARQVSP